ncbi:hypothetical protein CHU98_g2657, partial [Xylaria longipes]
PSDSQVFRVARSGSPTSLRKLFDTGLASPYDRTIDGETLVHEAARGLNVGTTRYPLVNILDSKRGQKDAEEFLKTIVLDRTLGSKLLVLSNHDESTYRNTRRSNSEEISSTMFESQISRLSLKCLRSPWILRTMMQPTWTEETGHNLRTQRDGDYYTNHEEEMYRDWDVAVSYPRRQGELYLYYKAPFRLIGFTYGPNPEDWAIYLSEPTDLFAGEFFGMINNPQRNIPGYWGDNDEF